MSSIPVSRDANLPRLGAEDGEQPAVSHAFTRAAVVTGGSRQGSSDAGGRLASLDFVKGALVLLMVLYHWLNYFVGLDWGGYRYLRFLTPAFIFITGFLVSHVYLQKYSYDDPQLQRRLIVRGLKLLILFVGLNVLAEYTFGGPVRSAGSGGSVLLNRASAIFVSGTGRAAFDILVSIGYFLLLAPVFLVLAKRLHISLSALAALAVVAMAVLSMTGPTNPHLEMLSIALVGLAAGAKHISRIEAAVRAPALLWLMYLIYIVAISTWNTLFILQVLGVCLSLLLIYWMAVAWGTEGRIQQCVVRMGGYSLLSYITQIGALQLLRVVLRGVPLTEVGLFLPLVATLAITILVVEIAVTLRERSRMADRLYRAVFA